MPRTCIALALSCGCALFQRAPNVLYGPQPCVGDVALRISSVINGFSGYMFVRREGDAFSYRERSVPAELVRALHLPFVGALPASGRCSYDTGPLVFELHDAVWATMRAAPPPARASAGGDASGGAVLYDLIAAVARIDEEVYGAYVEAEQRAPIERSSPFRELITSSKIWRWDGPTPLEITAQHAATDTTAEQVAEVAAALREPLPGFEFERVEIRCNPWRSSDCAALDVVVKGHWRGVRVLAQAEILEGRPQLAGVHAVGELLSSPLVGAMLEIRHRRPGFASVLGEPPRCYGNALYYDDGFELSIVPGRGAIELLWPLDDTDEITAALDRLGQWDTIVAISETIHDAPPYGPQWLRRVWVDRDGRRILPELAPHP